MAIVTQDSSNEEKLEWIEQRCLASWRHCREYRGSHPLHGHEDYDEQRILAEEIAEMKL
jgi:hypothetical protein